jgi:signal transduction histidine kinase/ActR/RegA family two-component response regulator
VNPAPLLVSPLALALVLVLVGVLVLGAALVVATRRAARQQAGQAALLADAESARGAALAAVREAEGAREERERMRAELETHRQAEEAQASAADELREAARLKDEFLATVAHELRTPLNAIIGWSHILKSGAADASTREQALDALIRNGERQSRLIGDLLDLSRVAAGQLRLDVQPSVELSSVVRAALDTVRPAAEAKGLRLSALVDALAGPLTADPHRLQQVVWNLLVNAVKFTPRGGVIAIHVERVDTGQVEIRVRDSGPGVPEDLLPHVFDRFRQGAGSARAHGGLGLGLAIVRHLVELHGGQVSVLNNAPEKGATFVVRLPPCPPASDGAASAASGASERRSLPSLEGLRVLVVAHEAETAELLSTIVRDRGAEVTSALSAAEALQEARAACPDVVIADVGLQGDDGFALVRSLRAVPAAEGGAAVAIALTARDRADDRVAALLAGFQGHVAKPAEPAELVALIASLTERARTPVSV